MFFLLTKLVWKSLAVRMSFFYIEQDDLQNKNYESANSNFSFGTQKKNLS